MDKALFFSLLALLMIAVLASVMLFQIRRIEALEQRLSMMEAFVGPTTILATDNEQKINRLYDMVEDYNLTLEQQKETVRDYSIKVDELAKVSHKPFVRKKVCRTVCK